MIRERWKPRKRLLLENPGVVRDLTEIQKAMSEYLGRKVTLEVVVDYLLQSYRHTNEKEASLEFDNFGARPQTIFKDQARVPSSRAPEPDDDQPYSPETWDDFAQKVDPQ